MKYWAGLYAEPDREQLIVGINTMLRVATRILKRQKEDKEARKQLQGGDPDEQDNASA